MHKLLKERKTMIENQIQRYQVGVDKITTTEGEVTEMQKKLEDLQPKLEKATVDNKALLVNLQKSQK
jgi:dynein heavy chain